HGQNEGGPRTELAAVEVPPVAALEHRVHLALLRGDREAADQRSCRQRRSVVEVQDAVLRWKERAGCLVVPPLERVGRGVGAVDDDPGGPDVEGGGRGGAGPPRLRT